MRPTGTLGFKPVVETAGDCYARCAVRVRELYSSIDLIRRAIEEMPEGPIDVKVKGAPNGEYFSRVEQPRERSSTTCGRRHQAPRPCPYQDTDARKHPCAREDAPGRQLADVRSSSSRSTPASAARRGEEGMGLFEMTKTVLRNLARGPATRRYPAVPARTSPLTRGMSPSTLPRAAPAGSVQGGAVRGDPPR